MGPEGVGGREGGAKVKAGPPGPAPLRGGWGRGGVLTPSRTHPLLGVQQGWGRPWERCWGGHRRMEGNTASAFAVHLGTREPVGLPGLILCPQSLPPATQSPSPTPTTPLRPLPLQMETHSENPSDCSGPKPDTYTLTQGLTSKFRTPHSETPLWTCCLSPSAQVLSRGPAPHLNVAPPRPRPQGLLLLHAS